MYHVVPSRSSCFSRLSSLFCSCFAFLEVPWHPESYFYIISSVLKTRSQYAGGLLPLFQVIVKKVLVSCGISVLVDVLVV